MEKYAPVIFDALNGLFCIYKPAGSSIRQVKTSIQIKLTQELNLMKGRSPRKLVKFNEGSSSSSVPIITAVPDLADHPLVMGPHYVMKDFNLYHIDTLAEFASGVQLMSIGHGGTGILMNLRDTSHVRVYHVSGQLGLATDDFSSNGRLIEKNTYGHVTQGKLDKTIAAMQAGNQRAMFMASGCNLQSEEAYDLAVKGLLRPKPHKKEVGTVIYGLKCIEFEPPNFTIEIHCINERNSYLMRIIHELGLTMKSTAVCTQVRRIRYGNFLLDHALLRQEWDSQSIIDNIQECKDIVAADKLLHAKDISEHSSLIESKLLAEQTNERQKLLTRGD